MSQMQHVVENVAFAAHSQPHNLTAGELKIIERARDAYTASGPVDCTGCRYCMPCPNGVDIPRIFSMYNEAVIYNAPEKPRKTYCSPRNFKEEQRADKCIKCGDCLEKCPQKLPVTDMLEKAHAFLTSK
jgi:predicted aldo/keto reductase-like oxidoreductase